MVDGFRVANDLRRSHPEAFNLLTRTPIVHRRFISGVGLRSEKPAITLDRFGEIAEIRWNERTMGPIDVGEHASQCLCIRASTCARNCAATRHACTHACTCSVSAPSARACPVDAYGRGVRRTRHG